MAKKWKFQEAELVIHTKSKNFFMKIHDCFQKSRNVPVKILF